MADSYIQLIKNSTKQSRPSSFVESVLRSGLERLNQNIFRELFLLGQWASAYTPTHPKPCPPAPSDKSQKQGRVPRGILGRDAYRSTV